MSQCSTPDGIEEDFTCRLANFVAQSTQCSTPDGIEEDFTGRDQGHQGPIDGVLNA